MPALRHALAAAGSILVAPLASAEERQVDPLHFFEGRTETQGTVKVMFHKPYRTRSIGAGRIEPDGTLTLVQRVEDEGKPSHERRWRVRRAGPDRFVASMTEAVGPVAIERIGNRYRFRFTMKGNMRAEQILTPQPDGRSARNIMKVKRMGITVATTEGTIRKI
ncbi:DUF3833 family protein [Sphingomonas sp. URHD0057]|uniref:DUF3833 family protein n=1 Tax=Sphingomonas sp. URHD0057 TaxID=1380389 RepID=UPI000688BDF8|nr:DUF3833 family protein [Sphingomonas sp. URHD0057]